MIELIDKKTSDPGNNQPKTNAAYLFLKQPVVLPDVLTSCYGENTGLDIKKDTAPMIAVQKLKEFYLCF
jgi:hypothetical protein